MGARRALAGAVLLIAVLAGAAADAHELPLRRAAQPFTLVYGGSAGMPGTEHLLDDYATPGALVVAGTVEADAPPVVDAARRGAHVLLYVDPVIDNPAGRYQSLLLEDSPCGPATGRWPGLPRASPHGDLTDFRTGSPLAAKLECVLETMVAEHPDAAGFFADDVGSRAYFPGWDWTRLAPAEKQAYRDGAVALVRALRSVADRHGMLVVVNGTWTGGDPARTGGGYPDPAADGNALADGGVVEHHDGQAAFFGPYACSGQWARESPVTRGLPVNLVITRSVPALAPFLATGCFAYGSAQSDYGTVLPPWGPFGHVATW
jgi:hypothetical protein